MIKIDMEMPQACCWCYCLNISSDGYECNAEKEKITDFYFLHEKPTWCPLIEVKE